jgi:RimJ/RimL family protein N-acetyltransferase
MQLPMVVPADLAVRLVGERVIVEPLSSEHQEGLVAAAADPATFRWMPADMTSPRAVRDALAAALAAADAGTEVPFAVRDAATGELIGSTRFCSLALDHLRAEIGWTWVTPARWGSGANVETKLLLLGHALQTVGLRRIEFKTDARNERSRGALAALGATFEGIFRRHMVLPGGEPRDSAYYSVIDADWPAVSAGLRRRLETAA